MQWKIFEFFVNPLDFFAPPSPCGLPNRDVITTHIEFAKSDKIVELEGLGGVAEFTEFAELGRFVEFSGGEVLVKREVRICVEMSEMRGLGWKRYSLQTSRPSTTSIWS